SGRNMTPEQQQEFATLFRDYVAQTYAEKLASFGGAPLRVTGTRQNGDETIVTSQVMRQGGPAELDWHVANRGRRMLVTDVTVNGSSMKVSERNQMAGIIERNGGRPDALLSVMRQQTAHAGAPQRPGAMPHQGMPAGGARGSSFSGFEEALSRHAGGGFFLRCSVPGQRLVTDAMRPLGLGAEPAAPVGLGVGVIAFEPHDLAVALEGEDVGRDTVEKTPVVRNDDGAARIIEQRLLQRAQRIDIEIVGRLVEQEEVGAFLQHLCEMHAVALAAGELPHLFLLVGAAEIEQRAIGAARDLAAAEIDLVLAARDLLPHGVTGPKRVARLVDVAELNRVADAELAAVGRLLLRHHAEQRRFAGAVRTDNPDNAARRQPEIQ